MLSSRIDQFVRVQVGRLLHAQAICIEICLGRKAPDSEVVAAILCGLGGLGDGRWDVDHDLPDRIPVAIDLHRRATCAG